MIAAQYTQGPGGGFVVREVAIPEIGDGDMLLRIDAASICGTDIKIIKHGHRKLRDRQTITLGHEFVGTIDRLGSGVRGFCLGQRVGVAPNVGRPGSEMSLRGLANMDPDFVAFGVNLDGGHTEYVRINSAAIEQGNVLKVPDCVPSIHATLAEPLSCAVSSVRNARIERGDTVLIVGAGPMGLLNLMYSAVSEAAELIVADLNDQRLAVARRLGATAVVNPSSIPLGEWVSDHTHGRGVDVVINAVPKPQLQQDLLSILAPFGRLSLFAGWPQGEDTVPLNTNPIHYKNLLVTGVTGGSNRDYATAMRLIAEKAADVSQIISDVVPIKELQRAYDIAEDAISMKVVLTAEGS